MKKLTNAQSKTKYAAVYDYLHKKEIPFSNLLQIATDGASAITDKLNGFIAKYRSCSSCAGNSLHFSSMTFCFSPCIVEEDVKQLVQMGDWIKVMGRL